MIFGGVVAFFMPQRLCQVKLKGLELEEVTHKHRHET
jgi:hypothetical protein